MSQFVLELNSHSLGAYKVCPYKYKLSNINLLELTTKAFPLNRGTGIARFLQYWYLARQKGYTEEKLKAFEFKLLRRMMRSPYFVDKTIGPVYLKGNKLRLSERSDDNREQIASRLMGYFNKYRTEPWEIVAVEKGFSKVIYESQHVKFIYSGRPDLVVSLQDHTEQSRIVVVDHKSESRANDLVVFQDQFLGYCWAANTQHLILNYIGLQKDSDNGAVLRRKGFTFTTEQINRWQSDTIEYYYKVMHSVVNKKFTRSWLCQGQYSVCQFYPICTSDSKVDRLIKIKRDYKKLEQPYKSW